MIQERAGLSATAIDELIDRLFKNVTLVPEADVLLQYRPAAEATSSHPDANQQRHFEDRDEDDVVFLATAMATDGDVWSDDGVFRLFRVQQPIVFGLLGYLLNESARVAEIEADPLRHRTVNNRGSRG